MDETNGDPVALGKRAIIATFAALIAEAASMLASGYQYFAPVQPDPDAPLDVSLDLVGDTATIVVAAVSILFVVVYLAAIVLVGMWIYRVNRNAHALSSAMEMSPGWNIGWFFIPIASWWMPFEGVRQAWQVSHDPDDPASVTVPAIMRWWWGLWVASNILGNITLRLSLGAETVAESNVITQLELLGLVISVPLAFALASVIRRLSAAQSNALRQRVFE